ncbi:MAG: aminotransferase class V-fold PLP-dependent enzyme [Anaerolineae bacterium]|nr:MAG: aminotransferase class V-fold PLP-dependent enzyme [Anaerolineae bacterium]
MSVPVKELPNIDQLREDFPITEEWVNLDNAGLSPFPRPVVEAVERLIDQRVRKGVLAYWDWVDTIQETKELIAGLIHASAEEIAFTQNTSEGINTVANMLEWKPGDNVVLNDLEFFPNYWPWIRLRKFGVETRLVKHREGLITTEDLARQMDSHTRVVALSSISWINGLKHDLAEIGALAKEHGAFLVVDAIQHVGVTELDVRQGPVDFLACGGHKWLFSLLGSGFFFCRRELIEHFEPAYVGWQSDADRFNYEFRDYRLAPDAQRFMHGNNNLAGVHGMHAGISFINRIGLQNIERRNRRLTDYLIENLQPLGVTFLSPLEDKYRSAILNFIPRDPARVQELATERKIIVCVREGGIRVSPNFYNTEEEIDRLIEVVRDCQ